jgi:carbamoyltransferase
VYILGISCFRDDATAALLKDGAIVGIAEEERFIRIKHAVKKLDGLFVTSLDEGESLGDFELRFFPMNSIEFLLREAGIDFTDIDYIAYDFDFRIRIDRFDEFKPVSEAASPKERMKLIHCWQYWQKLLRDFAQRCRAELVYVPHHLAHACGTVFASGFERTNFLIIDGFGELSATTLGFFDREFKILHKVPLPHSLGFLYSAITKFLGFRPFSGEQKTMGLAAYGDDIYRTQLEKMAWITPDGFSTNPHYIWAYLGMDSSRPSALPQLLGVLPRDQMTSAVEGEYPHIACSLQLQLERIVFHLIDILNSIHPSERLCMAGGVALNCQMNGKIAQRSDIGELFIQPQAGDSGTALGAACYLYFSLTGQRSEPLRHAYWGPGYSNGEVRAVLDRLKLPYRRLDDVTGETARLLEEGKIVGWFQGRSECGPRALGNRSILADGAIPGMNDLVNLHVKNRETWRPFAASILDKDHSAYIAARPFSPYMLLSLPLTERGRRELRSASHVNGTTRPQIVSRETNPLFYALLEAFKRRTGKGALLNTSFNIKGEPIVNSPAEAIRDFYLTGLDVLVVNDFLLLKSSEANSG